MNNRPTHSEKESLQAGSPFARPGIPSPQALPSIECIPVITAIDPPRGNVLTDIRIIGEKFQPATPNCGPIDIPPIVTFFDSHPGGTIVAAVKSVKDTEIVARVPDGAKTGLVSVTNTKGISSPVPGSFTVLPTIVSFSPTRGGVGTTVKIEGTGLYNTPQFFFRGKDDAEIPANFSDATLSSILVSVPDGAVSGFIKVVTKGGGTVQTTTNFTVTAAPPQVGNFMPKNGPPGTKVTIFAKDGTKFESISSVSFLTNPNSIGQARRIKLGPSQFSVSGDKTRIEVLVPDGAVTGKIRVTNETSSSSTSKEFRVRLATPVGLAARDAGSRIELTWKDATTTETGFRLERTVGESDAGYVPIATLPPNTVSYVDTNVTAGTTYRYRLFAFNNIEGDSPPSNPAIVTANGNIRTDPIRLSFAGERDGANPAAQPLAITRGISAGMEQNWSASDDQPWLLIKPDAGMTPGSASVAVDLFGLQPGRYVGVIFVRSAGSMPSIVTVPVELTVRAPAGTINIVIDAGDPTEPKDEKEGKESKEKEKELKEGKEKEKEGKESKEKESKESKEKEKELKEGKEKEKEGKEAKDKEGKESRKEGKEVKEKDSDKTRLKDASDGKRLGIETSFQAAGVVPPASAPLNREDLDQPQPAQPRWPHFIGRALRPTLNQGLPDAEKPQPPVG
jgi:hypothetical protein